MPQNSIHEQARLAALRSYQVLDSAIAHDYDELTELAAAICQTPIALISFVDEQRQWFKSHKGLPVRETARSHSFCSHAIQDPGNLMEVEDTHTDPRFQHNPLVTGAPRIKFYAGMPLVDDQGYALGTLCVIDHQSKKLSPHQQQALKILSKQVVNKLLLSKKVKDLEVANLENKYVHQKTREAEKKFRLVVEQSPAAIAVFRGSSYVIDAINPPMLDLLDQHPDIQGKPILDVIPELKSQSAYTLLSKVYHTGETMYRYDTPVTLNRNGKKDIGFFNFTYAPLFEDGQITGVISMAIEVTDQVNARLAIEESAHQMREMVMNAAMGMCIIRGEDLVIEIANDPMLRIWTRTAEQVLGNRLTDVFPEVVDQPFPDLLRKVLHTGEALAIPELTADIAETDGRINRIYIDFAYKPLKNSDGVPEAIIATVTDITEAVRARQALEASQNRLQEKEASLRLSIEAARMGTYNLNLNTGVVDINQYGRELFGFADDLVITAEHEFGLMAEDEDRVRGAVQYAIANDTTFEEEFQIIRKSDSVVRWVRAVGKTSDMLAGAGKRFHGTMVDITDRKASDQLKEDFIGIVSHEMRSPLTALKGYVQLLEWKLKKAGDRLAVDIATKATRQVDRMTTLITGFLDLARAGEGKIYLNKTIFDLTSIFRMVEEESLVTIHSHQVRFAPVERMLVTADRDKIEQVLVNFVHNAVKYSPNNSTVYVSCSSGEEWVRVSVKDEGMGISETDQQRIFERFYRVIGTKTENISGFGIGLYLCKEIIEGHAGRIGVESTQGVGSTFWFELPIATN